MIDLGDCRGSSDEGEHQDMIPFDSYTEFLFNDSPEQDPGEDQGEEKVHENPPRNWSKAIVFSSSLEALNEHVDEEILRTNDIAHKHPEDIYKPPIIPPHEAGNTLDAGQSWHKIKLPLVTFRGPWQDIPNPDKDAMGGKYYGQILYSWASQKHKPIKSGLAALTVRSLPTPNGMPTIPQDQQPVVKPMSVIERRMARQRTGVRKSSRAKNSPPKK
ncbi:hypothetical protein L873DRAFT_1802941 [Choiromyces venosus 120613-1]|uniref:Uncharacterized protein n=1 Tax=Choiromyces venosus 120613-1 TaxID=1336337 RepID=A0A3N4JZY9_9PEZI|nr:hypothetical protein L873DRAFT_1802941 [Choiromyces venosus 120613-1]